MRIGRFEQKDEVVSAEVGLENTLGNTWLIGVPESENVINIFSMMV